MLDVEHAGAGDPAIGQGARATALDLMRMALALLDRVGETNAAARLRGIIGMVEEG